MADDVLFDENSPLSNHFDSELGQSKLYFLQSFCVFVANPLCKDVDELGSLAESFKAMLGNLLFNLFILETIFDYLLVSVFCHYEWRYGAIFRDLILKCI